MKEKIAVVGSGMAGLAAAWYLGAEHEVTVLEKHAGAGISTHGVNAEAGRIDVPLRVIYPGYYPELFALLDEAGVDIEPLDASLSFTDAAGRCFFRYANHGLGGVTLPLVAPRMLRDADARRIIRDLARFMLQVPGELAQGRLKGLSIGQYLRDRRYSHAFSDAFLIPCFAGINTVSNDHVRDTPAEVIAGYFSRGFLFSRVYRAKGGASAIAAALSRRIAHARFGVGISEVRREANGVAVRLQDGSEQRFDRVIFATQANQVLPLLSDASDAERGALTGIRYDRVEVLMHRDTRLVPAQRASWSPVNYMLSDQHDRPMITIWVNALLPGHDVAAEPVFQTLNPQIEADEALVLQRTTLERPIVDGNTATHIDRLLGLHAEPGRRVFFCGSYAARGIPLLESATASSKAVARWIGAQLR
jgi:predicted NAD/FAD-binding protein